jgi:hypothetical protein
MSNKINFFQPDAKGDIDVPDELMPLVNKFGMQMRLHKLSGKNEVVTVVHMAQLAKAYADEQIELFSSAIAEGGELWKDEYDNCRQVLIELVELKRIKDEQGKTEDYATRQPKAWQAAKEFLSKYQHH